MTGFLPEYREQVTHVCDSSALNDGFCSLAPVDRSVKFCSKQPQLSCQRRQEPPSIRSSFFGRQMQRRLLINLTGQSLCMRSGNSQTSALIPAERRQPTSMPHHIAHGGKPPSSYVLVAPQPNAIVLTRYSLNFIRSVEQPSPETGTRTWTTLTRERPLMQLIE